MSDYIPQTIALYTTKALAQFPDPKLNYTITTDLPIIGDLSSHGITPEKHAAALVDQLAEYGGNAYFCWPNSHHTNELVVQNKLLSGGNAGLAKPNPPDLRIPPLDDAIQADYVAKLANYFGEPLTEAAQDEAVRTFSHVVVNYPKHKAALGEQVILFLVLNGVLYVPGGMGSLIGGLSVPESALGAYAGQRLSDLVILIDRPRNPALYSKLFSGYAPGPSVG